MAKKGYKQLTKHILVIEAILLLLSGVLVLLEIFTYHRNYVENSKMFHKVTYDMGEREVESILGRGYLIKEIPSWVPSGITVDAVKGYDMNLMLETGGVCDVVVLYNQGKVVGKAAMNLHGKSMFTEEETKETMNWLRNRYIGMGSMIGGAFLLLFIATFLLRRQTEIGPLTPETVIITFIMVIVAAFIIYLSTIVLFVGCELLIPIPD